MAKQSRKGLPKRTGHKKAYHANYYATNYLRNKLRHILKHNSYEDAMKWVAAHTGLTTLQKLWNKLLNDKPEWFKHKYHV